MANWIYNGVELPALPERDKATFPYLWICCSTSGKYTLFMTDGKWEHVVEDTRNWFRKGVGVTVRYDVYKHRTSTNEWYLYTSVPADNVDAAYNGSAVWANFDMYSRGTDTVYLAASKPEGAPDNSWMPNGDEPAEGVSIGKKYLLHRMFPPCIVKVLIER